MTMRRWALALLAATFVSALAVSAATAARPERAPLILEDGEVTDTCSFPVAIEIIQNKEYVTSFSDGRLLITGKLFVRFTNSDEPANSLRLNLTGSLHITSSLERGAGHNLYFLFPWDAGGPGIILISGRVDVVRDENFAIVELRTRAAPKLDVCAALS
jgi:hypothetical protein